MDTKLENNFKNILSWIIKGLLFVVPFIPLYIAPNLFFPFITGKAFVFRAIVEITFSLWLILALFFKEYRPRKNWLLWAIGIFIGIVTLATVVGVNPLRSFWSNFERMEGLVMYLHLAAYFLVLGNVFKKRDWTILFNAFIVSGIIEGFYGVLQEIGKIPSPQGGNRIDGTIGNPAYLAAFMMFVAAFCVYLFLKTKNIYARIYYAISGVFSLVIIYFTATRGPVLGILVALFLTGVGYLVFKKADPSIDGGGDKKIKKILIWGLIGLVVLVGALWGLKNTNFIKNNPTLSRLTNLSFSETTVTSRFSIWKMSFEAFKERPILGWGPENYVVVFSKYYSPEMWKQEPWFDRSHDIVFDWLINAGILGLLSYLSIFFFAFWYLYKNYREKKINLWEYVLVVGLFIAYFIQNLFVFDEIATYIPFFAILAWIYSVSTQEEREKLEKRAAFDINYYPLITALVLAVSFFYSYFITIKPYFANTNLIKAVAYAKNYPDIAYKYYQDVFNENVFLGRDEALNQYVDFAVNAAKSSSLSNDQKQAILELAAKKIEESKSQNSLDPRPYLFSGIFYNNIGQTEQAIQDLERAHSLAPKKQDVSLALAKIYLNNKQFDKAMPILLDTFNEDKSNPDARLSLAMGYIYTGNQDAADQVLMEGYGKVNVASDLLVNAYYSVKNYSRLLDTWNEFVAENPTNTGYLQSLAGAYLLNGQRNDAILTLKKIPAIDPSLESKVDEYISAIEEGRM
jgi:O-antigen ligase